MLKHQARIRRELANALAVKAAALFEELGPDMAIGTVRNAILESILDALATEEQVKTGSVDQDRSSKLYEALSKLVTEHVAQIVAQGSGEGN